jgi:hypothetical protein
VKLIAFLGMTLFSAAQTIALWLFWNHVINAWYPSHPMAFWQAVIVFFVLDMGHYLNHLWYKMYENLKEIN